MLNTAMRPLARNFHIVSSAFVKKHSKGILYTRSKIISLINTTFISSNYILIKDILIRIQTNIYAWLSHQWKSLQLPLTVKPFEKEYQRKMPFYAGFHHSGCTVLLLRMQCTFFRITEHTRTKTILKWLKN